MCVDVHDAVTDLSKEDAAIVGQVLEKSNIEVGFELRVKAYIWKMSELFTHMKVNAFLFQSLCAFCRAKQRVLGKARGGRRSKRVQTGSQWACL